MIKEGHSASLTVNKIITYTSNFFQSEDAWNKSSGEINAVENENAI